MSEEKLPRPGVGVEDGGGRSGAAPHKRREVWLGAILVLLTFGLLVEAKLWRPKSRFTITENVQIAEADAWWNGRLDLPERRWDTALKDGRVYSHFPPMFTLIAACLVPLFSGVPHWCLVAGLVLPALLLAYAVFLRATGSPVWGAILAIGLVCGTSLFPVLQKTLSGASPYFVNQTLGGLGLLIMLAESFGRRRVWVAGGGLAIAALSRQLTAAYILPLVYLTLCDTRRGDRARRIVALAVITVVIVALPCILNTLKFGHPFDAGYMRVYTGRPEDDFSRDARTYGIFSARYVPRNLYYANLGFPRLHRIEVEGEWQTHIRPNRMGTGIWWTTPLLLWLFLDIRRILRRPLAKVWLIGACAVAAALLFYHSTGYEQRGFNRYSLDYVPVILALVAPSCVVGWRRWATVPMIVWSVIYFRFLI